MRKLVALALGLVLVAQPGCALLLRGQTEAVEISGNQLEVDGKPERPGTVELRRRQVHVISAVVNGQRQTRVLESDLHVAWFAIDLAVFGVFLCPVGSITFLVDLATGALNEFDTTEVSFPTGHRGNSLAGEIPASSGLPQEICPHCGTRFGEKAKFCAECGAKRAD